MAVLVSWSAYGVSGALFARKLDALAESLQRTAISSCELTTLSDPRKGDYGWSSRALLESPYGESCEVTLRAPERIGRGRKIVCVGRFSPNEGEYGESQRTRGIAGSVKAVSIASVELENSLVKPLILLRELLLDAIDAERSPARALLAALVLGSREGLETHAADAELQRVGLAHVIAVSGTHLAILASIANDLLEASNLGSTSRRASLTGICLVFALLTGAAPSTLRAWTMVTARLAGESLGRMSRGGDGVGLAACIMLALRPQLAGELGFLLSVVCVSSLCLLGPYAQYAFELLLVPKRMPAAVPYRARRNARDVLRSFAQALSASSLALLVCLPLTVPLSSSIPLMGPVSCVVAIPLFTASMVLGLPALGCSVLPGLGEAALFAATLPCELLLRCAALLRSLPMSSLPAEAGPWLYLVSIAAPLAVYLIWPRLSAATLRRAVLIACFVAFSQVVAWRFFASTRAVVLDIGQGDAILIQDGRHAVLVDTGPDDAVIAALARNHVMHLDAVVITHLHDDHYGGLDEIADLVSIDNVYVGEGAVEEAMKIEELRAAVDKAGAALDELAFGDVLHVGCFEAKVVWPEESLSGLDNAHSLEIIFEADNARGELSLLLTGDAEQEETGRVVASGRVGDIDVLKVGHHGSAVSISDESAISLSAELALVSAGEYNDYGHPAPECVDVLERAGSRVLTTFEHGDISVYPGHSGPRVRCSKGCG